MQTQWWRKMTCECDLRCRSKIFLDWRRHDGNATAGNLNIVGSDISGRRVALRAKNDVNIVSATDTDASRSTNKSSSASVGVSYGAQGFGVSASASKSKGNADSTSATQVNSRIRGTDSVSVISGKDTNIQGATVSGGRVTADVGGNLNIASRQDTSQSTAQQQSMGGGLSVSMGGASGSFSASRGKASSNYANVSEQSGIFAGEGGFDINVKGNTDLKGAVIASEATKDKNRLSTGTLTWSDIQNHSEYSAKSMGVSAGGAMGSPLGQSNSGPTSGKNTGGISPMIPQNESGSQDGVARSAVADGSITITNGADQKQDVASLSRDTSNTNTQVGNTPDLQNVLNKQADTMAAAQAAGEAVAKSVGDIAGSKQRAALAKAKEASDAGNQELAQQYRDEAAKWDEGGANRAALHAAGGALIAGLGGGNAVAGAVGAGAVSLAGKKLDELSQSVAGSVGSSNGDLNEAIGNLVSNVAAGGIGLAVGGGSGAATAANVDRFNRQLQPEDKTVAQQIAAKAAAQGLTNPDGSPISVAQLEDTMRSANNSALNAGASAGSIVAKDDPSAIYDAGAKFAPIGDGTMQQQVISKADPYLASLIQSMTGGDESPYSWIGIPSGKSSGTVYSTTTPHLGGGCATGECGAGVQPARITAPPPTKTQLAEATDKGGTALALASPWLPPPFDLGAAAMAGAFKATNYLLSPPTVGRVWFDSASAVVGVILPGTPGVQTTFNFGAAVAPPLIAPSLDGHGKK